MFILYALTLAYQVCFSYSLIDRSALLGVGRENKVAVCGLSIIITKKRNLSKENNMSNHFFVRISTFFIAITILLLLPTILPAKEKAASSQAGASLVNINTASESQLAELPGIGPSIAERIVRYRQKTGPFKTPEDLKQVKGIGDKIYMKIKPLIITNQTS